MPTHPILFFGRLHPLIIHLPIGFLILLAIMEIASRFENFKSAGEARGIIVFMTAMSAVAAIVCGLMLSTEGGYAPHLLFWHRTLGILLGLAILTTAWSVWQRQWKLYRGALLASVLILMPASHFGGSLTHGEDYLLAYAPAWLRPKPVVAMTTTQPIHAANQAELYSDLVQPILQQNCVACHGQGKTSGQLRLDSFTAILHGGKGGPAVTSGNSSASLLIQRITLSGSDEKHMPPDGKPQPSDDQIEVLRWWIDSGAAEHESVADAKPTADQQAMVNRLLKLPEPADPTTVPPITLADVQSQLLLIVPKTGIVATPLVVDQPWLVINASLNASFGDAELAQLAPLSPNIVDLNLAHTQVTDAGLSAVAAMPNLRRLRLDRTSITDKGLASLSQLTNLEYLNLYGTGVTDQGLKSLMGLANLRQLYLWQTKVTPQAAAAFAASRTDEQKIERIKKQIEKLQEQIAGAKMTIVEGIRPTTQPTTAK
jgi:uncharacterized membrane protein